MTTELTTTSTAAIILPAAPDKHTKHRLTKFSNWLARSSHQWHSPDLAAYRDYLLAAGGTDGDPLSPSTVQAHLSTIRGRYAAIIRERDLFYRVAAQQTDAPLERKALVDEIITRLENAMAPAAAPVKVKTSQDKPDAAHLRLTTAQAEALMAAPGVDNLLGLRDTAVIATMLCTGVREAELAALDAPDLRQRLGGELALHVREGKGCKERLIPYGELEWVLAVMDKWMGAAGISEIPFRGQEEAVYRSFFRGGRRLRGRLSVRAIQYILASYPIMVDGKLTKVKPHDLRRTYARRLYEAGVDLVAIQQNLGHASQQTTLGYIGTLDVARRKPPAVYSFDLSSLNGIPVKVRLPEGSG